MRRPTITDGFVSSSRPTAEVFMHTTHPFALRIWLLICVVAAWVVAAPHAVADEGRDFSATYDITSLHAGDGQTVKVRINLELYNHSRTYFTEARMLLADPVHPGAALKEVATTELPGRTFVKLAGTVEVDSTQYLRWQRGAKPELLVRCTDTAGRTVEKTIDLVWRQGAGATP
jgi:hypothetical protein